MHGAKYLDSLRFICYMFHIHVLLTYQPHSIRMLASIYSSISTLVFLTLNLSSFFVASCLLVFAVGSSTEPASHLAPTEIGTLQG